LHVRALTQPNRHNCRDANRNYTHWPAEFPKASPEASSVRLPRIISSLSLLILNLGLQERVFHVVATKSIDREPQKEKKSRQANAAQISSQAEFEAARRLSNVSPEVRCVSSLENRARGYLSCQHNTHCTKLLC
jgi:hypothetical protein